MKGNYLILTFFFNAVIGLICTSCTAPISKKEWGEVFNGYGVSGTFVLKNLTTRQVSVYNQERSREAYSPASTFKIFNAMVALQERVVNIDDTLQWDGTPYAMEIWNRHQTMQTAFTASCLWYFQELARRVGSQTMQKWISKVGYGNQTLSSEIDGFWLDGSMKISAMEQIDFLEKLATENLPFDKEIQRVVKNIMLIESTPGYQWYAKSGWSGQIGWYVGMVVTPSAVWVFAMNIDMNHIGMADLRKKITFEILHQTGILSK